MTDVIVKHDVVYHLDTEATNSGRKVTVFF